MRTCYLIAAVVIAAISPGVAWTAPTSTPTPALKPASTPGPAKKPAAAVRDLLQAAKLAMTEGQRRQAVRALDDARVLAQGRERIREIDAKRKLYAEQFFSSESFQKAQEAGELAGLERWDECIRAITPIVIEDQDNLVVLRKKSECLVGLKQYDEAVKSYQTILGMVPGDLSATFGLAETAFLQKNAQQGLAILDGISPKASSDVERFAIIKSRLLEQAGRAEDALEVLVRDQETNFDHTAILFELGMAYSKLKGREWQVKKMLALFVERCKRMKEAELDARGFTASLAKAQAVLAELEKTEKASVSK